MKQWIALFPVGLMIAGCTTTKTEKSGSLFDAELSSFELWMGIPHDIVNKSNQFRALLRTGTDHFYNK